MQAEPTHFASGTILNQRYRLDRELGRGGMGAVFLGRDLLLDAPVALKLLHLERPTEAAAKRFLQEARAAAQVRHANIVSVLDLGQDVATKALYIVQEYLDGTDLRRHLAAHGAMSPVAALEILLPVMRALAFAHSKGIVHRDLKPDNIFLCATPDGDVPKVIDFGIAKVTDEQGQSAQNTRTTQILGTPYFMSPEQARGDRAVDHRTDIWSLGVVLYNLLTQRHPHEGATVNLIITNIIARAPTPITAHKPSLESPVVELVHRALQYEADARFASMETFHQAAKACLAAMTGAASPSTPDVRGVGHVSVTPPAPTAARPLPAAVPAPPAANADPQMVFAQAPVTRTAPARAEAHPPPRPTSAADGLTVAPQVLAGSSDDVVRGPNRRAALVGGLAALALVAGVAGFLATRASGGQVSRAAALSAPVSQHATSAPPAPVAATVTAVELAAPQPTGAADSTPVHAARDPVAGAPAVVRPASVAEAQRRPNGALRPRVRPAPRREVRAVGAPTNARSPAADCPGCY